MISDFKNKKILLISPHPDDIEIGMGGTAVLLSKKNKLSHITCTNGSGSYNNYKNKEILVKKRRKEALESNKFLNIRENFFYDIDNVKSRKNIAEFERNIKCDIAKIKPNILFCPHPTLDRHATHRKISKSILKIINSSNIRVFFYEVWGPFNKYHYYVDIGDVIKEKIKLIKFHKSQMSYKNYVKGIIGLNTFHAKFNDFGKNNLEFIEVFIEKTI